MKISTAFLVTLIGCASLPASVHGIDAMLNAIGAFTDCMVEKCPSDDVCPVVIEGETCQAIEQGCQQITAQCCPPCATELANVMGAIAGSACPPFSCASSGSRFLSEVEEELEEAIHVDFDVIRSLQDNETETPVDPCVGTTVIEYMNCARPKCPTEVKSTECKDLADGSASDCAGIQEECQAYTSICCPACETELANTLDCGGRDECADSPFDCTAATGGPGPAPTTEAPAPTTEAPAPTTEAPAPTTEAPAPTSHAATNGLVLTVLLGGMSLAIGASDY